MLPWIIALYIVSAILPLVGLGRLLVTALREARAVRDAPQRADGALSIGQHTAALGPTVNTILQRPRGVVIDFATIGAGLVLGCVASIMSLLV
jgi:hypothetical protein